MNEELLQLARDASSCSERLMLGFSGAFEEGEVSPGTGRLDLADEQRAGLGLAGDLRHGCSEWHGSGSQVRGLAEAVDRAAVARSARDARVRLGERHDESSVLFDLVPALVVGGAFDHHASDGSEEVGVAVELGVVLLGDAVGGEDRSDVRVARLSEAFLDGLLAELWRVREESSVRGLGRQLLVWGSLLSDRQWLDGSMQHFRGPTCVADRPSTASSSICS